MFSPLVQRDCDTCGPHAFCVACGRYCCDHTGAFLRDAPDPGAAIAALVQMPPGAVEAELAAWLARYGAAR